MDDFTLDPSDPLVSPAAETTTPLALAVPTAEATLTAIASTSVDMSLTTTLESSFALSDNPPSLSSGVQQYPSPSSPLTIADLTSCCGGCTGSSSTTPAASKIPRSPGELVASMAAMTTNGEPRTPLNTRPKINDKKNRKVVRIDIYSDTTCPWCYVSKKRLEKAIRAFQIISSSPSISAEEALNTVIEESANSIVSTGCSNSPQQPPSSFSPKNTTVTSDSILQHQEDQEIYFDIHWRPFQLDPNAPRIPIRKKQLYERKFGPDKVSQIQSRIVNAGKAEGIKFLYADQSLYSNTIDSHRTIRFARERLGRLPLTQTARERKMVDSGNSCGPHAYEQDSYFPTFVDPDPNEDENEDDEVDELDELGARMEDAMVEELFRSHFERGECSEFETLKSCARSVLEQTAAFSAAAAAALSSSSPSISASSVSNPQQQTTASVHTTATTVSHSNTNHKPLDSELEYSRLLKEKEQELIDQQIQELDLYLHSDEDLDEVMEEIRMAKEDLGMQGVPMIVIQNEYLLSGAQTPATFVQVLQRVV
ncbi:hypothetical protein FBU30_001680 [Linnemannia zychae]|nr:hypothetical protein FBU30_001680 [Linnemannia zychae]